mmetsp:Transcript_30323/g.70850  ORF Transcript_30323/g.70850 Transcript_30323/m.70850 type:complete len:211 (+) Transcript_30323:362-994(+)
MRTWVHLCSMTAVSSRILEPLLVREKHSIDLALHPARPFLEQERIPLVPAVGPKNEVGDRMQFAANPTRRVPSGWLGPEPALATTIRTTRNRWLRLDFSRYFPWTARRRPPRTTTRQWCHCARGILRPRAIGGTKTNADNSLALHHKQSWPVGWILRHCNLVVPHLVSPLAHPLPTVAQVASVQFGYSTWPPWLLIFDAMPRIPLPYVPR